jgi:sorbitol-specific phosphotransferase system component IIBC
METLIEQALGVVGLAVGGWIVALLVQLFRKAGIELDEKREAQLRDAAAAAIAKAEEWAAAQLKGKFANKKIPGQEKFERAVGDVLAKIPNVSREEAEDIVTAMLPQMGLGAAAGAAALGKALRTKK